MLDRLVIVPFNCVFSKEDPDFDPYIKYKLRSPEVMSHLINIGLAGLQRVLENQSFTIPRTVEKELEEYAVANNPILGFFDEVEEGDIVNQPTSEVFKEYMAYAIKANVKPLSQNEFTRQVNRHYGVKSVTKRVGAKRIRMFAK